MDLFRTLRRIERGELLPSVQYDDQANIANSKHVKSKNSTHINMEAVAPVLVKSLPVRSYVKHTMVEPTAITKNTVIPVPRPPQEVSIDSLRRFSTILDREAQRARSETVIQAAQTTASLVRAQKIIPATFLKQYHLHEELKRNAIEKLFLVCAKLRMRNMHDVLLFWRKLSCILTFQKCYN